MLQVKKNAAAVKISLNFQLPFPAPMELKKEQNVRKRQQIDGKEILCNMVK